MKSPDSSSLTAEIKKLGEKRTRLHVDLEMAEESHKAARDSLVQAAREGGVDSVSATHSRVLALKEAVSTLDTQLEEKRLELKETQEREQRQSTLDQIGKLRQQQDQAGKSYFQLREQANNTLLETLKEMVTARERWSSLGAEADRLASSIGHAGSLSNRLRVPLLEPFGVEVDTAFSKFVRLEERRRRKARAANAA